MDLSWGISTTLKIALAALDFGEVCPIVEPQNKGLHGNSFTLAQYKLVAIEYVGFLVGQGIKKTAAERRVAKLFGVSPHTLRSWSSRDLLKIFKQESISKVIKKARVAGEHWAIKQDNPDYDIPNEPEWDFYELHNVWNKFKDNAIKQYVAQYREILQNGTVTPKKRDTDAN